MKSADGGLQAKALAALIAKSPRIGITSYDEEGIAAGTQLFEITLLNEQNLTFTGKYFEGYGRAPET